MYNTCMTMHIILLFFIEVPVPSHESEWSCISVLGVSIIMILMVFLLDFANVLRLVFFIIFHLYKTHR